jgi:hypothetical protein
MRQGITKWDAIILIIASGVGIPPIDRRRQARTVKKSRTRVPSDTV